MAKYRNSIDGPAPGPTSMVDVHVLNLIWILKSFYFAMGFRFVKGLVCLYLDIRMSSAEVYVFNLPIPSKPIASLKYMFISGILQT